jgi:hypothetical protein
MGHRLESIIYSEPPLGSREKAKKSERERERSRERELE